MQQPPNYPGYGGWQQPQQPNTQYPPQWQGPQWQQPNTQYPPQGYQQPSQPMPMPSFQGYQQPPMMPGQQPTPPRRKRSPWLLIGVIIAIIALIAFAGVAFLRAPSPTTVTHQVTSTPTHAQTPSPTATPKTKHFGQSAQAILEGLKAKGLPIGAFFSYTEATDVNKLLGRPGQYTGKVNFKDTRVSSTSQGADISVSDGGSVEVFATETDARNRFTYIQTISKSGNPLFAEYEYLDGTVILRISAQLTASQAANYQTALQALP